VQSVDSFERGDITFLSHAHDILVSHFSYFGLPWCAHFSFLPIFACSSPRAACQLRGAA
jgi:hypothetical protein